MTKVSELRKVTDRQLKPTYWETSSVTIVQSGPATYTYNDYDEPRVIVRDGPHLLAMDFWPEDNETYLGYIVNTLTNEVRPVYPWEFDAMAHYMLSIIEDPREYPLRYSEH